MELQTEKSKGFPDNLPPGWKTRLSDEKDKDYFRSLTRFLANEYQAKRTIYPQREHVLRALQAVDYENVKVVILGQDPYHGSHQAIGLSFAVPNALKPKPPSLMNIFKEIASDLKVDMAGKGTDLSGWTEQGVLLLNTVLTVRASEAFSHRKMGWEHFTDRIISELNDRSESVIFMLWGSPARKKKELITNKHHFVLEAAHPSPLSAHSGFFGCRHFSKVNAILKKLGRPEIDWARTVSEASSSG